LIARESPPTSLTSPTPADLSMRSLTRLSASSVSSRSERGPVIASESTGDESLSNFEITGGFASRGRRETTCATRSRTSWAAVSMSRFRSKVTSRSELPCAAIERSSTMLSTVLTTSSMRWQTSVSFSSGEAPASSVRIEICGRSTAGKRSTPSFVQAVAPTTTSARMIIEAKIGRRMLISASFCTSVAECAGSCRAGPAPSAG
jgi:hypothetical protein